jgi:hypothetical protein
MQESHIPIMGYVYIGVTALTLALVTVLDKSGAQNDNKSPESSTSMLPNIFPTTKTATVEEEEEPAQSTKVGGRKKRKTRRRKRKN